MLNDDLQKLGIDLNPDSQPMGNCRTEDLAPILYAVTELLPTTPANRAFVQDMRTLRYQYESGMITGDAEDAWRMDVEGHLKMAWSDVQALDAEEQKLFTDRYQREADKGKQRYPMTAAMRINELGDQCSYRTQQMLDSALSPEEIAAYNEASVAVQKKTGIRAPLNRTYGYSEFYTWLVAEKGFSIDDVFALSDKKSRQEIHDLFKEFEKDLNTVYSITPDGARIMGERQSRFLDALADVQFADIEPKTPQEIRTAMEKAAFLNGILVDWVQDTPDLTGISDGKTFDPVQSAAFYQGAGGKDSYEKRLQVMHGRLNGITALFGSRFPKADDPVEIATRMSWFQDVWQNYRGKKLGDVEVPGFSMQDYISRKITEAATEREVNPPQVAPEMKAEAETYLSGSSPTISWKAEADERFAKIREEARRGENNQISVVAYRLAASPFDPGQIADALPPAGADVTKMTDEQRKQALDKVSVGFQTAFGARIDTRGMEPLYSRGKDSFDVIRIDGKSVRELADAELAGQSWAQPSSPGGPEPAQKIQYMQMMVLKKMSDPESHVTMTLAQVDEKGQLKDMPPIEFSAPVKEMKLGPVKSIFTDIDLAEAARNLLVEGVPQEGLTDDIRALSTGFEEAKKIAIPQSQQDAMKRFGKDMYDTIFINGKSVNEVYRETFGDQYNNRPTTQEVLKDALIMAHRMQPDARIEMWRVDEQASEFTLKDPVAIGVLDDVKGLSKAQKQDIHALNESLAKSLDPESRKKVGTAPMLADGVSIEKLKKIDEIWAKMESEKQGLHHDSREYREMKEAVKAVHDAMADFHPSDPNAQAEMRRLLDQVSTTATEYTRLKAYDKTKKTGRGVERKNTALALMDLVGAQVDEARVTDRRLTKSEAKRTNKPLSELMREEHEATASAHGAEATRSRKARRHQAAEERKRTDQPAPTAPTGK